ncbi:unnamed protein product [Rotaria sp. Silwood1]|nr:unnamed protein product [Rotaria sp. Silwood1]CAF4663910.1 unnamed protein product [Rotaria sp. Silwood1]
MTNISTVISKTIKSAINIPNNHDKFRICIGLITNTLTIVFLSKGFVTKNLRNKWTLIALALSDLIHNIALLIRVTQDIISGKIECICLIISFLSHLAELLSACFTVLFTVQRYTAVRYPLQAAVQEGSSPIIHLLLVFIFSLTFCITLIYSNTYINCYEELKLSWFIADALLSFVIPFSLILTYNLFIVNLIRKHARSPFNIQSTLLKSNRHVRKGIHYNFRKSTRSKDSFSITYSYGVPLTSHGTPLTSHGTLFETDIDKRLSPSFSSSKSNKSCISIRTSQQRSPCNISNETEFQACIIPSPMLQIEKLNSDTLSTNHSSSISHQSTKSERDFKNQNQHKLSNPFNSRRLLSLSRDADFVSNKSSQTTQSIRVTRMLVLVSTCFLILNAPAHLCVIALKIYTGIDSPIYNKHSELDKFQQATNLTSHEMKNIVFIQTKGYTTTENKYLLANDTNIVDDHQMIVPLFYTVILLTQLISYASYSINFFLYSFSGVVFRTRVRQFFNKLH